MSKYHFCRLFKKSTNLTPYQYVLQRRTARAKELLKKRELTIVEIAYLLGFSDQSHFTRQFKKQYGITPGAFLKK
jgi:AraC family transcriptional regulator